MDWGIIAGLTVLTLAFHMPFFSVAAKVGKLLTEEELHEH
jgi:hypothetical protein